MKATTLKTRKTDSLLGDLERMQRRITERAYDLFKRRSVLGAALDDWLVAENQSVWKPAVEVCQKDNALVIEAAVAGIEPGDLDIQVTPDSVLIKSETTHTHPETKGTVHLCEFHAGQLFRLIQLPAKIDPDAVKAEYRNGLLRMTAAIAEPMQARKVDIRAA